MYDHEVDVPRLTAHVDLGHADEPDGPLPGAIREAPRRVLDVDLEGGSLLVMSYETQLHYTHGVPKTNGWVGERISLAFRVRPADDGPAGRARSGSYR